MEIIVSNLILSDEKWVKEALWNDVIKPKITNPESAYYKALKKFVDNDYKSANLNDIIKLYRIKLLTENLDLEGKMVTIENNINIDIKEVFKKFDKFYEDWLSITKGYANHGLPICNSFQEEYREAIDKKEALDKVIQKIKEIIDANRGK